jgi:8-oxo-dGTP pyrophosphatase MutT (NUDIX family)
MVSCAVFNDRIKFMFIPFITQLKHRLQQPLPGEEAQFTMSPIGRPKLKDIQVDSYKPKKSAVLILLFPQEEIIKTVFIVRPVYEGVHSGQVAFPGGKFDKSDSNLKQTALRETHEEIGINPENIEIIGNLTDVYINPSNFLVTPFIGYLNATPQFTADAREVDKIVTYNILELNNAAIKSEKLIKLSMGFEIKAPYYEVEGNTVWGATAMMISEFNVIIEEVKSTIW